MRTTYFKMMYKLILICCLGLFLANCEGEDGAVGPAGENGIDGVDGANGTNGANGTDGENGAGFDELTKFGSITLTLNGTRPDNEPFINTAIFKFTPIEISNNTFFVKDELTIFDVSRFLSVPDDAFQRTLAFIDFGVNNSGTPEQKIDSFILNIENYSVISDDLKYFEIDEKFNIFKDKAISNISITNYSFNEETNHLIFSFSFDVAAAENDTGNDLSVSGEVDVILLKKIFIPKSK